MKKILHLPIDKIDITLAADHTIAQALEQGQIAFFPHLPFTLLADEQALMNESVIHDARVKNISYDRIQQTIKGCQPEAALPLQALMKRYADFALDMIKNFTPAYVEHVVWGRTSFRPVEIKGRARSKLQDDTKLHVDAFPATPVQGNRLLRVFANINPHNQGRRWLVGEPFEQVAARYMPKAPSYNRLKAKAYQAFKLTKSLRTPYDHYMLHLHDSMKLDPVYQEQVDKEIMDFPAGTCWMVYTDQVSHAALSGQFLLEQTFYLAPDVMLAPHQSPLGVLERMRGERLRD